MYLSKRQLWQQRKEKCLKPIVFKGSAVALVTPMREDGSVNQQVLEELLTFHLTHHTDAIVVAGTTGASAADSVLCGENRWETACYSRSRQQQYSPRRPFVEGGGAANGRSALLEVTSHNPDIILLDLGLPDMDGVKIIENIREWSIVPIIVVSARSEDADKIRALDAGADDHLTKPFSIEELLARIRVAQRRLTMQQSSGVSETAVFKNGQIELIMRPVVLI